MQGSSLARNPKGSTGLGEGFAFRFGCGSSGFWGFGAGCLKGREDGLDGLSSVSNRAVAVFIGLHGPSIQEDTCNHVKDPLGHVPQRCGPSFLKLELGDVVAVIRHLGHPSS